MTNVTRRTTTTVRHEVVIPTPTAHNEIYLALEWARKDWAANVDKDATMYDDTIMVDVGDEEIVVYWEEEKRS